MPLSAMILAGAAGTALGAPVPQEPMVVTASRIRQPAAEALSGVTVIERDDIERSQARDLLELLRLQTGVELSRTGGPGQQTSLFLRGTNSNHVLVLVDGVRVNSVQSGAFTWEHLPVDQVERIEIVRGPQAASWGSEALGGVIQIFTRRPEGARVEAEAGSYDTVGASAALGGGDANRWHVTASAEQSDGFSAQKPGAFAFDPDDDGYDNASLSGGGELDLGDAGSLSFTGLVTDAEVEFDQGESETEDRTFGLDWRIGDHQIQIGHDRESLETPVFDSGFRADRTTLDWQTGGGFADGARWNLGLNYRHEDGESYSLATGDATYGGDRDNTGLFGGVRYPFGDWDAELALRHDENSEFGSHTTGRAALARSLGERTRVWVSHGTAFRGPNLNEQFSPGFGGQFAGNPDLDPETAASTELALEHSFNGGHRLTLNAWHNEIEDLIAFAGENFRAININQARIDGLEARWRWTGEAWRMAAGATFQDTEDESTGESLLRRADEQFALTVDRQLLSRGNLGVEVLHHGDRRGLGETLGAYTLVNLRARVPLGEQWTLTGRVENLFDEDYELAAGFNTPGASAYLGVEWQMR